MSLQTIRLENAQWKMDTSHSIGDGGFSNVFAGISMEGTNVAIKMLSVLHAASKSKQREMKIVRSFIGKNLRYVMPVLDCGQDAETDDWFVVMPLAEISLDDYIKSTGKLQAQETFKVLEDVVRGLMEAGNITHRDLKPGNILKYENTWRVADFGSAKFSAASTSNNTVRESFTPLFAAPEQWRGEPTTSATDVYALGCIAHNCLSGAPPFEGNQEELMEHHLHSPAPAIPEVPFNVQSILTLMTRKEPGLRPKLDRVLELVTRSISVSDENNYIGKRSLAEASARLLSKEAEFEAEEQRSLRQREQQLAIAKNSCIILRKIVERLASEARTAAPNLQVFDSLDKDNHLQIWLGSGRLDIRLPYEKHPYDPCEFVRCRKNILLQGFISVRQEAEHKRYKGRSANLLLMCDFERDDFRWWEVCFMHSPLHIYSNAESEPFSMNHPAQIDEAIAPGLSSFQLGARPRLIDDEDEQTFIDRWLALLAQAADGALERPSLPLDR